MSPLVKIVLVVVVLLVLIGTAAIAGLYYAFHLAARKAHEISQQVRNGAITAARPDEDAAPTISGPGLCRLLSKEDVGRAIGIAIVATRTTANGCEYLAQGTTGEMTSKHLSAMMAGSGASAQQQQMMKSLSKGLFGGSHADDGSTPNADENTAVLAFTIGTASQTQLPGSKLAGIGDEAAVTAGSVMVVRKGSKLIRVTYSTCPCTTPAIVPLAKRLAASQ